MEIKKEEKKIIRELGKKVAEIAALPSQNNTRKLWESLNALKPIRPMVLIDQIPWHEMNVDEELTLKCKHDFCRSLEWKLRETLYRWKHIRADMVVENFIDIEKVINNTGFGIHSKEDTKSSDPYNLIVSHRYFDQIQKEEDILKITTPKISLDKKSTAFREEVASEIFDGILGVRMVGITPYFAPWDRIAEWHSVERSLLDLVEKPDFAHKLMARFTEAHLLMLDQIEKQGLLAYDVSTIHCSGAYTHEIPQSGFNPLHPRSKDTWTYGMAQVLAAVSPSMHDEFEIEYAIKWYKRFGLIYYGCCEPLHNKIDIVKRIPGLRKISISPWADAQRSAEQIGRDYVLSSKPMPAYLATDTWNKELIERELKHILKVSLANECPLEFILKDISTVRYHPERLWQWSDLAGALVR